MNETTSKHSGILTKLVGFAILMFGFGYALVPLYDVFCDITGINGKTGEVVSEASLNYQVDKSREITVEFITSLNEQTAIKFRAETKKIKVHPGEFYTVNFIAKNLTGKPMLAQAIPSVSPSLAAEYFQKTECFCFSQQEFKVDEEKVMPVRFVINPDLPKRYKTVTLAYTFFDVTKQPVNK